MSAITMTLHSDDQGYSIPGGNAGTAFAQGFCD